MGESACWLHLVCDVCGRVDEEVDPDGHCPDCRPAPPAHGDDESAYRPPAAGHVVGDRLPGHHVDPVPTTLPGAARDNSHPPPA